MKRVGEFYNDHLRLHHKYFKEHPEKRVSVKRLSDNVERYAREIFAKHWKDVATGVRLVSKSVHDIS